MIFTIPVICPLFLQGVATAVPHPSPALDARDCPHDNCLRSYYLLFWSWDSILTLCSYYRLNIHDQKCNCRLFPLLLDNGHTSCYICTFHASGTNHCNGLPSTVSLASSKSRSSVQTSLIPTRFDTTQYLLFSCTDAEMCHRRPITLGRLWHAYWRRWHARPVLHEFL
jgi:hypothetical protein